MMNWRKVVCILGAAALCVGLVVAGQPGTTDKSPGQKTSSAWAPKPGVQTAIGLRQAQRPAPDQDRACGGWAAFDNYAWQGYYFGSGVDNWVYMSVYLGCNQPSFNMSCYHFNVANPDATDQTFEAAWFTGANDNPGLDCPLGYTQIPGTYSSFVVAAGAQPQLQFDLTAPVTIPEAGHVMAYFGIKTSSTGGPILGGPQFGFSDNMFCSTSGNGWYWFGGVPYAAFYMQAFSNDPALTGACCYGGCVGTTTAADCSAMYGVWFCGESCPDYICPPPPVNDTCDVATAVVGSGPNGNLVAGDVVVITGDSMYAGPDDGCLGAGAPPAVWFKFQVNEPLDVKIDSTGTSPDFTWIYFIVFPQCPCDGVAAEAFGAYWTWWPFTLQYYRVLPGQDWFYPLLSDPGQQRAAYTLTFIATTPCDVTGTGTPEAEICGTDTNGGCNMGAPAFEPVACGETIVGTVWADPSTRDTDWYQLTTTTWQQLTWTVTGELPMAGIIIDGTCGCAGAPEIASATASVCTPAVVTACVPPGTYWLWAGPNAWSSWPCSDNIQYTAVLDCVACTGPTAYCDALIQTNGWEYISEVAVGTLDNPSGRGATPYEDFTGLTPPELKLGDSYTITVTNGSGYSTDSCGAWIDYSQDFAFECTENILMSMYNVGPYTNTFTVPATALTGLTRMRVRIDGWNLTPPPCSTDTNTYVYGEVEDYTVKIVPGFARGDVNCDGFVNAFDIDPFVQCLVSGTPTPPCPDCSLADINLDTFVNAFDIDPFVNCIVSGGCP